jgi:hypothetical protein
MKKTRIAVLIALAMGVPLGVVAVERAATELPQAGAAAQPVEPLPQAAQPAEPLPQAEPAPASERAETAPAPVAQPEPVPVQRTVEMNAFPAGHLDYQTELTPSQIAYFERIERERQSVVAFGDAFPDGHLDYQTELPPSQIAYFDRLEQQRLARLEAARPPVAVAPAASEPAASPSEVSAPISATAPAAEQVPSAEPERVVAAEQRNPLERAADFVTRPFREEAPAAPAPEPAPADRSIPMAVDHRVPMTADSGTEPAERPAQ